MAINKVEYYGKVLLDLTEDTVTPETLVEGNTAHGKDGTIIAGTNPYAKAATDATVDEQASLISQIKTALQGKVSGGGTSTQTQEKTVEITENGTVEITPDDGYALSKVTANVNVPTSTDESTNTEWFAALIQNEAVEIYNDKAVGTLRAYAFYECEGVTKIELPNIQYLKERCFYSCGNLETLLLPGLVGYTYQYMAGYCSNLVTVDIHNASHISSYTFRDCTKLAEVDLHKADTINTYAFNGCKKLTTLILRMDEVPTLSGTNAFTNTPIASGTGYIYVPKTLADGSDGVAAYQAATNWSTYTDQFRILEDYTVDGTATGALDESKI